MTRINVVPPECLSDKHLMAEYFELPRVFTAVLKASNAGKLPSDYSIPSNYVLGKGHVIFFYNKIAWLRDRFNLLYLELLNRGTKIDSSKYYNVKYNAHSILNKWCNDWEPSRKDMYLNMARLVKRSGFTEALEEMK